MGTVKCCEVRVVKANLLPLLFGCLGVIMGFALRDAFFAPSVSLEQVPTFLQSANQGQVPAPVPAQEERYVTTIVNPTFPLQVKGEWDPLKIAVRKCLRAGKAAAPLFGTTASWRGNPKPRAAMWACLTVLCTGATRDNSATTLHQLTTTDTSALGKAP